MPIVYLPGHEPPGDDFDSTGGGGDDGDMEARVAKLEQLAEKTGERLGAIESRLGKIEARMEEFTRHYSTKADVTEAKNSIIMWVVSSIFLAQLLPPLLKRFLG